jgi:hypothetical protein
MIYKTTKKSLFDAYQFENFKTTKQVKGKFGDKQSRVITLTRRQKKAFVLIAVNGIEGGMIARRSWYAIFRAVIGEFIWNLRYGGYDAARRVA